MTGATCLARNVQLGHADIRPRQIFSAFECLYLGNNARMERKWERVGEAELIMRTLAMQAPACFEMLATARSAEEKQALCDKQKAEGREGEVFFLSDLRYVPGKITSGKDPQFDGYVRTKYSVGVQRYRITKVEPSRAEGHAIGGFEIEDTDGKPVGSVGTGYSRSQQVEILRRFTEKPNDTWVLVDAQVKTIFGKLRHARFLGFPEEE